MSTHGFVVAILSDVMYYVVDDLLSEFNVHSGKSQKACFEVGWQIRGACKGEMYHRQIPVWQRQNTR
jgi:hypothetical protein